MLISQEFIRGSIKRAQYLRKQQTKAEILLWKRLQNRRLHDLKFRRQFPIGKYVVDFMCLEKRIAIEIDGDVHIYKEKSDTRKIIFLEQQGFCVLRFTNTQVKEHPGWVLSEISKKAGIPVNDTDPDSIKLSSPLPEGEG